MLRQSCLVFETLFEPLLELAGLEDSELGDDTTGDEVSRCDVKRRIPTVHFYVAKQKRKSSNCVMV